MPKFSKKTCVSVVNLTTFHPQQLPQKMIIIGALSLKERQPRRQSIGLFRGTKLTCVLIWPMTSVKESPFFSLIFERSRVFTFDAVGAASLTSFFLEW